MQETWYDKIDKDNLPTHVAFIMDGNGRWAKMRNKRRNEGHREGANTLKKVSETAIKLGIPYITVYAFSTENWNRPKAEVKYLMNLLSTSMDKYRKDALESDTRIKIIGDITRLDKSLQKKLIDIQEITKDHKTLNLQMAINYGSRDEMIRSIKKMGQDIQKGQLEVDDIDEDLMDQYLDTAGIPDPDFLIRTSGEQRLSNYLLWQLAYAEFYFPETNWPDFGEEEFHKALYYYQNRDRRFGAL